MVLLGTRDHHGVVQRLGADCQAINQVTDRRWSHPRLIVGIQVLQRSRNGSGLKVLQRAFPTNADQGFHHAALRRMSFLLCSENKGRHHLLVLLSHRRTKLRDDTAQCTRIQRIQMPQTMTDADNLPAEHLGHFRVLVFGVTGNNHPVTLDNVPLQKHTHRG